MLLVAPPPMHGPDLIDSIILSDPPVWFVFISVLLVFGLIAILVLLLAEALEIRRIRSSHRVHFGKTYGTFYLVEWRVNR